MPIVFDEIDAVVQPAPEPSEGVPAGASANQDKPDTRRLMKELEHEQRRRARLQAD